MTQIGTSGRRALNALALAAAIYLALAYGLAPTVWSHFEHQRGLATKSMVTTTSAGIPGDALNVGLEGTREAIVCAMRAAGWVAADALSLSSDAEIVGSVLARRAYPNAPVSSLYWEGRKQDLAFEKPVGASPSQRHHVRFWKALESGANGVPVWLGSATFDSSVGVSHYTGQVTHHIDADIDAERERLMADLSASGHVEARYLVSGVGPTLYARNGGGDPYFTDGEVAMARLRPGCESQPGAPPTLGAPAATTAKAVAFGWLRRLWRAAR